MKRSWRGFWIGSTVFLLGLGVVPLAAFQGPQDAQTTQADRPELQSCRHLVQKTPPLGSPNAGNLDCSGGGGGCAR
jgi:hypothetical protein